MQSLLVLSPHRDDAVFSLAMALCYWRALPVTLSVANFFTRSNYGPRAITRDKREAGVTSRHRQREDGRALAMINRRIRVRSAGLWDAPLRLGIDSSAVCNFDEGSVREDDVNLASKILAALCRTSAVIAPLGLGNHVDHLTVRAAAIDSVPGQALAFYEDLPYVTWTSESAILERVRDTEQRTRVPLSPVTLRSSCNVYQKRRLVNQYRTQIEPTEAAAIAGFASKYRAGERIWAPRHSAIWKRLI